MKIEVNIEKRHFVVLSVLLVVLIGIGFTYAYNLDGVGGNPAVAGHSVDEIDWSKTIVSDVNISGNISGAGFCLGGSCKTNWIQVGGISGSDCYDTGKGVYGPYTAATCGGGYAVMRVMINANGLAGVTCCRVG